MTSVTCAFVESRVWPRARIIQNNIAESGCLAVTLTLEEIYQKNKTIEGSILKFHADRGPVLFIYGVFLAQLLAWWFLPLAGAVVAGILLLPFLGTCAIYNHHQQHHNAFRSPFLNRVFETVLGVQTMISGYGWVLHHNFGHHPNYMNQPPDADEDESRWARRDGSKMGRIEYSLNLMFRAPYDSIKVGVCKRPKVLAYFFLMFLVYLAVQFALAWVNWQNWLAVFLVPSVCMLLYVYDLTYEHHSGLYTKNHYEASRNRVGRLYNIRTCNLGYHTAHHIKPYIHWSLLPAYHELIKDKIPPHCYVKCR